MRRTKIFCVGLNKTGTSSLELTLRDMGYRVGDQSTAEQRFERWVKRDFTWLKDFCETAEAFQDAPFSFPFTFVYLDQVFPRSKFILTLRDSADAWYQSLLRFHQQVASVDRRAARSLPFAVKHLFGTSDDDPYEKHRAIDYYDQHNAAVATYFKYRPHDLLTINVGARGALQRLATFLGRKPPYAEFPHVLPHASGT